MNRSRWILGAVILLNLADLAPGQEQSPFAPPTPAAALMPPAPVTVPAPSPARAILEPQPAPFARAVPDRVANAGFLFGMELALIRLELGGALAGGTLDTTVSPTVMFGYRFPSGRSLLLEYRYFGADGNSTVFLAGDPGPTNIHRHVEGNIFDLNVRFLESEWPFFFRSQWELGARDVNISVFASQPSPNYFSVVSNRFEGAGPHAVWRLAWAVFDTGLELFGRSDVAVLFGSNQGYSQQMPSPGIPGTPISHTARGEVAWNGRFQVGASYWFNWGMSQVFIAGGYEVDGYYFNNAGEVTTTSGPGAVRVINKGPFLRVEFKY